MKTSFAFTRPARTLAPLALAAALAGCSMAPKYDRPAAPIDTAYPSGAAYVELAAATPDDAITAEIGWRDFFRDPLLQQLIGISLENNRDMHKAALNVEAAQALYRIQRAEMLPNLGVSARGASERVPADLSTTGQSDVLRRYDVAGVTAAWELDLWGRIRSLNDRALASYLALDETRIATQMSLVSEVASAYLTLRADQELLRLTSDTLATQKRSYDLTTQLVEAGNSTQLDLRRAEIALRTAEANRAAYTRQAAKDRNALVLLLGQPLTPELSRQLDEAVALPDDIVPTDLPSGLPSELLARRPDIRAAERRLAASTADVGVATADLFPRVSLSGFLGFTAGRGSQIGSSAARAWSVGPSISWAAFDLGSVRARLRGAKADADAALASYEQQVLLALEESANAFSDYGKRQERLVSLVRQSEASRAAAQQAAIRYREGTTDFLVLLDAEREQLSAEDAQAQAEVELYRGIVAIYRSLGGGWQPSA
ncbi:efflux transporter outer membrane subunit [Pseudomonas aeruginosa]|uniref:efflux transporter outer membrane subunit n=1 Tax=Pseudomonas aeruginosa TaxID=287 RepID=UPI0006505D3F|nr:efflux transporter outer membrane subunit [Pseudomonas aeruginosa]